MRSTIHINGAGLQGLLLGYRLKKQNIPFILHEKSDRFGGWIDSFIDSGFFFEKGPRGFRPHGQGEETLRLLAELQLDKELLLANPLAKRRYILHQGKLRDSSSFILPTIKAIFSDLFAKRGVTPDESVEEFFVRRVGRSAFDQFIDPLVTGIYAGDPQLLSMKGSFQELFFLEKRWRSLFLGFLLRKKKKKDPRFATTPLVTLRGGLKTLTEALYREVGSFIRFGSTHKEGIACYSNPEFPKASLVLLHVGYHRQEPPYLGFGYLVPYKERENILGAIFDSVTFPEQNRHAQELRMTIMMGGMRNKELLELDDRAIYTIGEEALQRHLGLPKPDFYRITRACEAISQIPIGMEGEAAGLNQAIGYAAEKYRALSLDL